MAAGVFKVSEILPSGLRGTVFSWTSSESPPFEENQRSVRGGGRAAPIGDWNQGGEMRSVPTSYTGNKLPTEQIQGPKEAPQSFSGRWDDRYNFQGFAQATFREFKALCERGNLVEVAFQSKSYVGILKRWNFAEKRDWDIRYSFDFSTHGTLEDLEAASLGLSDRIETSPLDYRDNVDAVLSELGLSHKVAPRSHMADGPGEAVDNALAVMEATMIGLDDAIDQRDLDVAAPTNPVSPFKALASRFGQLRADALDVQQQLTEARSDLDLAVVTAKSVLDYEEWTRSTRFHARVIMGQSLEAETDMESRDNPEVDRLYRAHEGESLMAISRQVYGTPHQWGVIYEANGLTSEILTEPEVLIIPQIGAA